MQNSCSWIPRCDFIRFCNGKRAADAKIEEVWNKQEERYLRILESGTGGTGGRSENRSPTPCPLGSAARQSPERQSDLRLSTPARQTPPRGQHGSLPSNAHLHPGQGSQSNPINIDRDGTHYTPASFDATSKSNVNPQAKPKLSIGGSAILNQDGFIAEKAEEEGWENMDEDQRKTRETMAKALYHVYVDTVAKAARAQDPVVGSAIPRVGAAVAAH
ncbi:hypothetical protein N7475_003593 [Penicillium sp. IBT 31633x]|nr:hypothetical protein N7475_003593 [Penicillium sp. IBT 31633x]